MQDGELLVAERLSPSGELRLQKGRRCSADEVLRATFRLCCGGTQAEAQNRHEANHRREHKSYHCLVSYLCIAGVTLPAMRPLHELPTVLMISNVSGWTDEVVDARVEVMAEYIRRVAQGEMLLNPVVP
jgi:hypothetical protein